MLGAGLAIYFPAGPGEIVEPALQRLTNVEHQIELQAQRRMRFLRGLAGWLGGHRSPL